MADARRARTERRASLATRVTQTAPVGSRPRRSPSPATNAATGPTGNEQQASSLHPLVRREGRTATPSLTPGVSSSHARRTPTDTHAALLLAHELLHYRPVDDLYEDWLARITELVSTAGGSPMQSLSLPRPHLAQEARIRRCLCQLLPKKVPWLQGAQPQDETLCGRRLRDKKGAARRSLAPKKVPACSQHRCAMTASLRHHIKTPHCSRQWCAGIPRSKPHIRKELRWPPQAAAPSPPSCVASHGLTNSSRTCLLATTALQTPVEFLQLYELGIDAHALHRQLPRHSRPALGHE